MFDAGESIGHIDQILKSFPFEEGDENHRPVTACKMHTNGTILRNNQF
jgi:hypothetical protein